MSKDYETIVKSRQLQSNLCVQQFTTTVIGCGSRVNQGPQKVACWFHLLPIHCVATVQTNLYLPSGMTIRTILRATHCQHFFFKDSEYTFIYVTYVYEYIYIYVFSLISRYQSSFIIDPHQSNMIPHLSVHPRMAPIPHPAGAALWKYG